MPEHPLGDVLGRVRVVVLAVCRLVAVERDDPLPGLSVVADLGVEERVVVHVEEARAVLRALDVAADPVEALRDTAEHRYPSTQVSLLPPPCDEFTTSDPSRSAVRVSPPGTIRTRSAPLRTNGRRST